MTDNGERIGNSTASARLRRRQDERLARAEGLVKAEKAARLNYEPAAGQP